MKKVVKTLAIVLAGTLTLASCGENLLSEITGSAEITISDAKGGSYYAPNGPADKTVKFSSAVTDAINESFDDPDMPSVIYGTIVLGANISLTESDAKLASPFLGIMTSDTTEGDFNITTVLTNELLPSFDVNSFLATPSNHTFVAMAVSDTSWYVSHSGVVQITEFPEYNKKASGKLNNVLAYYMTASELERAVNDIESGVIEGNFNPDEYFHPVTMNGTFDCRRIGMKKFIDQLKSR